MKTFMISLSMLFVTSIYASEYTKALAYYKSGDYNTSYALLSKLYISNLSNRDLNFYLGRSAYETKNYSMALATYERILMFEETNMEVKLELGRTYQALKMQTEAQEIFRSILKTKGTSIVLKKKAMHYIEVKEIKRSFTDVVLNVDLLYDSNINYSSGDNIISDQALQVYAGIQNIYDIGEKNGFAIKNNITFFLREYQNENYYSTKFISYSPSLLYLRNNSLFDISVGIDNLYTFQTDYLQTIYFKPKYSYSHSKNIKSNLYIKYQEKGFKRDVDKDLDARHLEFYYALGIQASETSLLNISVIGINEAKKRGTRVDVDYDEYIVRVEYLHNFTKDLSTDMLVQYRDRSYSDFNSVYNSLRNDRAKRVRLNLNLDLTQSLRCYMRTMYSKQDSNQESFSFDKYTVNFGLNKTF